MTLSDEDNRHSECMDITWSTEAPIERSDNDHEEPSERLSTSLEPNTSPPSPGVAAHTEVRKLSEIEIDRCVRSLDRLLMEVQVISDRRTSSRDIWRAQTIFYSLETVLKAHGLSWHTRADGLPVTPESLLISHSNRQDVRFPDTASSRVEPRKDLDGRRETPQNPTHESPVSVTNTSSRNKVKHFSDQAKAKVNAFIANLQSTDYSTLARLQELLALDRLPIFSDPEEVVDEHCDHSTMSHVVTSIKACLMFLTKMDDVQDIAMIRTNCAYWVLGSAFETYAEKVRRHERATTLVPARHARSQVHYVLQQLEHEICVRGLLTDADGAVIPARRKAFVQRVQRARKYVRLTKVLPESLLLAVPQVCVTRIDKLSFESLQYLEEDPDVDVFRATAGIIEALQPLQASVRAGLNNISASLLLP